MAAERWLARLIAVTVGCALWLGVLAAVIGGPLTPLGSGPGGLAGLPFLILTGSTLAGVVLALRAATAGRWRAAAALAGGPILVWAAFQLVAHVLDPCYAGIWTLNSDLAGEPACESFGAAGVSIHTRWHLLVHALVAAPFAVAFWWIAGRPHRAHD